MKAVTNDDGATSGATPTAPQGWQGLRGSFATRSPGADTESFSRAQRFAASPLSKPFRAMGGFYAMALDTLVTIPQRPFAWREFLDQSWFVARVSLLPALMLAFPFTVLLIFTFNLVLLELGAADYSGAGAAWATVQEVGPVVTVLVISGAGATAICADLGARKIREELDALNVLGINPIQALVVPRVLACMLVATLLSALVIVIGLAGAFFFSVFVQNVTPGAFIGGMPLVVDGTKVAVSFVKAAVFGLIAGLIGCYKGISVAGGPAGVGNAVNETVVLTFVALFSVNVVITVVGFKIELAGV